MSKFIELEPEQVSAALDSHPSTYRFMIRKCHDGAKYIVVKTADGIRFIVCSKAYGKVEDAERALEIRSRLSKAFEKVAKTIRENAYHDLPWTDSGPRCLQ